MGGDDEIEETPTQHAQMFDDAGPLADPQERRVVFAALDSFQ